MGLGGGGQGLGINVSVPFSSIMVTVFLFTQMCICVMSFNANLEQDGLGFLTDYRRINVAFSRAERLLVIVGSWDFFVRQLAYVSLDNKLDRLWFWKKILAVMQEYFANGKAIKVSHSNIQQ